MPLRNLELDPHVKAIVSSGYSDDPVMSHFEEHGFCGAVAKPYGKRSSTTFEARRATGAIRFSGRLSSSSVMLAR